MSIPIVGIYRIWSPSGRVYIGQSWNIKRRWHCHRNDRRESGRLIQRSFKKYGVEAHRFEIVHVFTENATQDRLNYWERYYIEIAKRLRIPILNLTNGGNNGRPVDEVRERLRKPKSGEHRANIAKAVARQWAEGKKQPVILSAESRQKISNTLKGQKFTDERCRNISLALRGRPPNSGSFGRGINPANTGRPISEETRRKISLTLRRRNALKRQENGA